MGWGARVGGIPSIENNKLPIVHVPSVELKNTKYPFLKILLAYSRFSRICKTEIMEVSACAFSNIFHVHDSELSSNNNIHYKRLGVFLYSLR